MLYYILTLFSLNIANLFVQSNYLEPFLLQSTENIIVCSGNFEDVNYEVLMPKNNQSIWISEWDCKTIPEVENSVIVLDEVQPNQFKGLLNQEGIQKSIFRNIWLIHIKNQNQQYKDFFVGNNLRIGLNAQIFIIRSFHNHDDIYQILGAGTTKVELKVSTINFVLIHVDANLSKFLCISF